jgi:hypothetical protein
MFYHKVHPYLYIVMIGCDEDVNLRYFDKSFYFFRFLYKFYLITVKKYKKHILSNLFKNLVI